MVKLEKQEADQFEVVTSGFLGDAMTRRIGLEHVTRELFEHMRALSQSDLLALHGLDRDVFGCICRSCKHAYCQTCWQGIHPTFEDGFFDDMRGTCPHGHEQMLQD